MIAELEEKKELAKTRETVLSKQEQRIKTSLKEHEAKINEMMKGAASSGAKSSPPNTGPPK